MLTKLKEKYTKNFCKYMGTFTFENIEVNKEIEKDMRRAGFFNKEFFQNQIIFSQGDN
jgi:hypothetical protein